MQFEGRRREHEDEEEAGQHSERRRGGERQILGARTPQSYSQGQNEQRKDRMIRSVSHTREIVSECEEHRPISTGFPEPLKNRRGALSEERDTGRRERDFEDR